jgi:hypothetical protein
MRSASSPLHRTVEWRRILSRSTVMEVGGTSGLVSIAPHHTNDDTNQ